MINKRNIELLAPAKNAELGMTAIRYGADAVYIATQNYGARNGAGNDIEDIERLCKYAHQFNAKVYATLNTILYDDELEKAKLTAIDLYNAGVDAYIIQDMAFLMMDIPKLPLFASTQVHNYEAAKIKFLELSGISRIILARELNLKQIQDISNSVNAELEFFVHGALCVSFSGRCYLSHNATGKSGNRGECRQLCRLKYDLLDSKKNVIIKDKHLLSLKDLNLSDYIEQLLNAGISSFKIEGRLKDENYIKNITAYYRQKIDEAIANNDAFAKSSHGIVRHTFEPMPERSFNRGFSNYFIEGGSSELANFDTPKSLGQFLGKVIDIDANTFKIDTSEQISNADGLCFTGHDGVFDGFYVNKITDGYITPNKDINIRIGTSIYRNYDYSFDKILENDKSERKLTIKFAVDISNDYLKVSAFDNRNNHISGDISYQVSDNHKNIETLVTQLKKTGNTIFNVEDVEINFSKAVFVPISEINKLRRDLLEKLSRKIIENHQRQIIERNNAKGEFPASEVDYSENVSNSLAEEFYKKSGVKVKEKAFELIDDRKGKVLMMTKYCIKREIGQCIKEQYRASNAEDMLISDGKRTYKLEFNCQKCVMKVLAQKD